MGCSMKEYIGLFNTNQINKYGYQFSIGALENSLNQIWEIGAPMFISHDFHRPLGWSKPLGLRILPSHVELIGLSMFAENEQEQEVINDFSSSYISRKIQSVEKSDAESLIEGIEHLLTGNEIFVIRECVSIIDDNIAKKLFPDLFVSDEKDKRSLCLLKDLNVIAPGVFEYEGRAVFAHRFFRRSLSQFNNLNFPFLKRLNELCKLEKLEVKIALDPHSIGLVDSYLTPIELDYWWGPKFDDSLQSIPLGVTKHEQPERERFFSGTSGTEFWWHNQDGIHSFECEELRDTPSMGVSEEDYGCRYVHSMVDKRGIPFHLDGAIRLYDESSYISRLDNPISSAGKNSNYYKLWRIDGDISVHMWKELISDFYRDNRLIGEYFEGVDNTSDISCSNANNEDESDPLYKYVPKYTIDADIQICVSYHPVDIFPGDNDVEVILVDSIVSNEKPISVVEFEGFDLIKNVRQTLGVACAIAEHAQFIAYEDFDVNLPIFVCRGKDAVSNAREIFNCIHAASTDKFGEEKRYITASVCVVYSEATVKYSIASNIHDLNELLSDDKFSIPREFSEVPEWISNQSEILNFKFPNENYEFKDRSILKKTGDFRISRTFVDHNKYIIKESGEFVYQLHESEIELVSLMVDRQCLFLAPVFLIESAKCHCCKKEYFKCGCMATFQGKGVTFDKGELLGGVWSNRSIWSVANGFDE